MLTKDSQGYPRRPRLFLGIRAHSQPSLRSCPRILGDKPSDQGPEWELSGLPRSSRNPQWQHFRRENELHHVDHHHPHRDQHISHRLRGRPAVRHIEQREGQEPRYYQHEQELFGGGFYCSTVGGYMRLSSHGDELCRLPDMIFLIWALIYCILA